MLFFLMLVNLVESRVFCQDSHAMGWTPRGYTCPVMCESVRNAIERLILLDYKKTVEEQFGNQDVKTLMMNDDAFPDYRMLKNNKYDNLRKPIDNSINEVEKETNRFDNAFENPMNPFMRVIVQNLRYVKGILRRSDSDTDVITESSDKLMNKCWVLEDFQPKLLLGKIVRKECTRKSNFDGRFLTIMTDILNRYANTLFKFTEEMTEVRWCVLECLTVAYVLLQLMIYLCINFPSKSVQLFSILLQSIFGKDTDLRNNIFDVNKLLKFLRNSLNVHKNHTDNEIILKSKHCMSIPLPGCYCKSGYVESSGQCVAPSDCVKSEYYTRYLSRIVVD